MKMANHTMDKGNMKKRTMVEKHYKGNIRLSKTNPTKIG
jgi:hypothetical protein